MKLQVWNVIETQPLARPRAGESALGSPCSLAGRSPGALQPPLFTDSFQHPWPPGPAPTGSAEKEQLLLHLAENTEEAQQGVRGCWDG